jgi:hypothetical protein
VGLRQAGIRVPACERSTFSTQSQHISLNNPLFLCVCSPFSCGCRLLVTIGG